MHLDGMPLRRIYIHLWTVVIPTLGILECPPFLAIFELVVVEDGKVVERQPPGTQADARAPVLQSSVLHKSGDHFSPES